MKSSFFRFTENFIGLAGALITTVSAILIFTLLAIDWLGFEGGPYLGIVTFLILPAVFVFGLLLIPSGLWLQRRRVQRKAEAGQPVLEKPPGRDLPVIDLNNDHTRLLTFLVAVATVINIVIIAGTTYKGVQLMESPGFCGKTCHKVMQPEYTAYQRSPHAKVKCVECHIGPGASWFVKSKLSGAWQLVSVTFNLYSKPIPTPVHNLRPARETCEECHWPSKFSGDKLKIFAHFQEDRQNTEKKTVMLVHVGGGGPSGSKGIHWHMDPNVKIRFLSDEKRETIGDVELQAADGSKTVFQAGSVDAEARKKMTWRTMDCIDCHNRPTHVYETAEEVVDSALESGRIDRSLPFIRREGLKTLKTQAGYRNQDEAYAGIKAALADFYGKDPAVKTMQPAPQLVDAAAKALAEGYARNVFPAMNVQWKTYTSFLGHEQSPGCYRCHDEAHTSAAGKSISMDCSLCHNILAQDDPAPKILKDLSGAK